MAQHRGWGTKRMLAALAMRSNASAPVRYRARASLFGALAWLAFGAALAPAEVFAQARTIWGTNYRITGSLPSSRQGFSVALPNTTASTTSTPSNCQSSANGPYGVLAFTGANSGTAGFYSPSAPTGTNGIGLSIDRVAALPGCASAASEVWRMDMTFTSAVDPEALRFHWLNLDAGTYVFSAVTPVRLAGNNIFDVVAAQVNAVAANALNGGCQTNSGANPSASCGSVSFTAATPTIGSLSFFVRDVEDNLRGGDSHTLALSITQPSLLIRKQTVGGVGSTSFTFNYPTNVVSNAAAGNVAATAESIAVGTNASFVNGAQRYIANSGLDTTITEPVPAGWRATAQCIDIANSNAVLAEIVTPIVGPADASVTLAAADVRPTSQVQCSFTNTRMWTLTVVKSLSPAADPGTFVMTANATDGTAAGNGATASARVQAATTATFSEAAGSAATVLGDYATTWSCNTNPATTGNGTSGSLTMPAADVTCTITNTRRTATLQLAKAWANGSTAGNQVTIGATTGGANNTASFDATAPTAATSGTAVTVNLGNTITLPPEGGTDAANYTTTVACTGGHTLSGTDGQQSNTLTITSTNPTVCTYTNAPRATDLSIAKTNTPNSGASDQTGDTVVAGVDTTYSVVVTNHAAAAVTGAVVRDTPQAGLNCPATNPVTCTGAACPSGNLTVGDLGNGVTLGMLAGGGTVAFGFTCSVQ